MNEKIISHNFTGKSIVVVFSNDKGVQHRIVEQTHLNWPSIMDAYKQGKYIEMLPLLDMNGCVNAKSAGKFTIQDGVVYYNGNPTQGYMFDQMLFFLKELPKQFDRLVKFADNLYENPDARAREETYKFLDAKQMPLTEDGCFLAYKGVDEDYYSKTAGVAIPIRGSIRPTNLTNKEDGKTLYTIFNGIGETIEVKREDVNPNPEKDCSYGLHVGSFSYADSFKHSGRLMIVKVNPRDVISVPYADAQKMRVSKYEVIGEEGHALEAKKNSNYDRASMVKYHNRRGPRGQFIPATAPYRDESGRFVSKS